MKGCPSREDAINLQSTIDWLKQTVNGCLRFRRGQADGFEVIPLKFYSENSWLAELMQHQNPSYEEFTVLMLAIAPHIQPTLFTQLIAEHLPEGGEFPEFGGVKGANHRGILPTGETAQFILAGDDLEKRLEVQRLFSNDHWFAQKRILWLAPVPEG